MARYLVTGGAGFIGSNIVRALLERGDYVRILDDFSTGRRENLASFYASIDLFEGSVCNLDTVQQAMEDIDYCLHQAAIPSVPRSIGNPNATNRANVDGTLNVFLAARDRNVKRVVFASSSSVYGNAVTMPVVETLPRAPISPYGVSKAADEMYAEVFCTLYGMDIVALRYFNVFGPNQDPNSQYAAVVPIFITAMTRDQQPPVHGDGQQARDFTFVENVVQANLKACMPEQNIAGVYNIACGQSVTVLALLETINGLLGKKISPAFEPSREGDIHKSWADIGKSSRVFGYVPEVTLAAGLEKTIAWLTK